MKLKKFKESDKKKIGIILFTIACILLVGGVVLYRTFAIFETNDEFDIINGVVQSKGDISFNFYINDVLVKEVPTKESGKIFDSYHSYCENGTNISWNAHSWEASIKNIKESPTKCHLKFIDGYEESILNGAVPDLGNGKLTPITIEENGIVKKADITNKDHPWYKYEEKKWANSVILKENSYELLKANGKINSEPILEEDSLHLDGVDDYVNLGLENKTFPNGVTWAIKFKLNENHTGENFALLGDWEGNTSGGGIYIVSNNVLQYHMCFSDGRCHSMNNGTSLMKGKVYTAIATYKDGQGKMYLDGENVASFEGGIRFQTGNAITLGTDLEKDGAIHYAKMNAYDAAIFNRAISEEEINEISNENFKITNGEGLLKYVDFTKKEYQPNEVIPEDNIESYFVWIPRYKYQLFSENPDQYSGIEKDLGIVANNDTITNLEKNTPIQITFETKDVNPSKGNTKGSWLTHPAFTSFNSNGIWVGKFESGYIGAKTITEAEVNEKNSEKLIIKPNVYSWRRIQVANAFYTSYEYQRELDSHMIKNMEWGAITYLTQSQYGRCTNGTCEKVRINNNGYNITGFSANFLPSCGWTGSNEECNKSENVEPNQDGSYSVNYNNPLSVVASTTGNYSGIYDMAGGAWEFTMGAMDSLNSNFPTSGYSSSDNSGFNGAYADGSGIKTNGYEWPDSKYYDLYQYSSSLYDYQRGIVGDATKELGPFYSITYDYGQKHLRNISSWNGEDAELAYINEPWVVRGGYKGDGSATGVFAFASASGDVNIQTFRVILVL